MNWRSKLETLITAAEQGHPTLRIGLDYNPPLEVGQIKQLAAGMAYDLPQALQDLYAISDGLVIGVHFRISGLVNERVTTNLATTNRRLLALVQEEWEKPHVRLVFGSDGGTGDLLCMTDDGSVLRVDPHNPDEEETVAVSLDAFFDEVCMGPGFTRLYKQNGGRFWIPILSEFGFLGKNSDMTT